MKAAFSRAASSRSFARSLSIVAVAVVAFAALQLLFVQPAFAGIVCCTALATGFPNTSDCLCDPSLTCSITRNNKLYNKQIAGRTCWNTSIFGSASTIKSDLSCSTISEEIFPKFTTNALEQSTSFKRTGIVDCEVLNSGPPPHDGEGRCAIELTYRKDSGLTTSCTSNGDGTSTRSYSAKCQEVTGDTNGLVVTGTLQCPKSLQPKNGNLPAFCQGNQACILNLGVENLGTGQCANVFPPDGTVLSFAETVNHPGCDAEANVASFTGPITNYCNGGTFNGAAVDCLVGSRVQAGGEESQTAVQFDVTFSPTTLNVTCNLNNNDVWRFTLTANQHTGPVSNINADTLRVGVQGALPDHPEQTRLATCDAPVGNTLSCEVAGCIAGAVDPSQELGTFVGLARNPDKTVDLAVTGFLDNGTAIIGVKHMPTSGKVVTSP
jgi:hypothetical protein